ncbi:helix-turn-helix domain-containing protein [Nocardia mexicana]|uniref:Helix-turn-helix protein n=1 Tax=Nocardia mexicana TaxID=279262 RepID=A0A370HB28_9NOCA|nr:helix-turn-helix transcriptional regulator [Nocardia mexicana]RDI54000.1 helix-turn-helix protein [Nocardia mexicana]
MHMTTGEVIRRIRKSLGMTQAELGVILGYTQPVISQLEHDAAAIHDVRVLRRIAKALHVPLAILVVESDEEADVNRRNFLRASVLGAGTAVTAGAAGQAAAASSTGSIHVGATEVAEVNASVGQIHELDLLVGGDRLCRLAANEVRYVKQLLDSGTYTEATAQTLTSAAAEMMTAAGWVHFDANKRQAARSLYAEAVQTANESGDGIAAAHALMNASIMDLATVGLPQGTEGSQLRPQKAANLAQAAQSAARGQGGPKVRALAALREAQAQGPTDRAAMERAMARAHRAYESGRGRDPDWVWLPEAEFNALMGISYLGAGMNAQAEAYLQAAHDTAGEWPREQAAWQLYRAQNHLDAGDPARACALLTDNYAAIQSVASSRLRRKLDSIATTARPHAVVPEVREFLELVASH